MFLPTGSLTTRIWTLASYHGSLYNSNFSVTRSAEKVRNSNAGNKFDQSYEKSDRSHEKSDGSHKKEDRCGDNKSDWTITSSECSCNKVDSESVTENGIRA